MGSIVIPGYKVEGKIKDGGFSSVYRGLRIVDHHTVALKILSERGQRDGFAAKTFRTEAKVLRELDHPKIIGFCDFITSTPRPVLILDFFPGESVKVLLYRKSALPHNHFVQLFRSAVEALGHLHDLGYVHRDFKPENILLGTEGEIRLIDFSLAQKRGGLLARLGRLGRRKRQGTPLYMSPEQIRMSSLDARSDLYSLGATLYEVLTGSPPFTGSSTDEILAKHLREKPRAIFENSLPIPLRELIMKMLSKDPRRRPQNPSEIYAVLNQFQDPVHGSVAS